MLRLMLMCVWNPVPVWISYRSFWQKWIFISGDKISCKRHLKWNGYTCPSKYQVTLKWSQNETSCKQNLFSRQFEISNRYEFISPVMWAHSNILGKSDQYEIHTHIEFQTQRTCALIATSTESALIRFVLGKLEHVYMRPEVNSNRFEISNSFEMSFCLHGKLHGDFTAATFQTIAKLYCTCANYIFKSRQT